MEKIVIGIVIATVGCALIIFRERFVRKIISFQNNSFGFRFGKRTTDIHTWIAIPFGLIFIVIGVFIMLGVFELGNFK